MAKPENSIKKIKLPGENTARDIIPDSLGSGSYIASLPTLSADATIATDIDLANKQDKYITEKTYIDGWTTKTWSGLENFYGGSNIWWLDDTLYYSSGSNQYVLNKVTLTWEPKVWQGIPNEFYGQYIWTDGDDLYYSYNSNQLKYSKQHNSWSTYVFSGLPKYLSGDKIWSDGENTYWSEGSYQYVLNKAQHSWSTKTWSGLVKLSGNQIWTDGENYYYSDTKSKQYVLNKATSTWSSKTWIGLTPLQPYFIWTDGTNIYYSDGANQYILDKSTSTWSAKEWTGLTSFDGRYIWSDDDNIYYSKNTEQYVRSDIETYILLTDLINEKQSTIDIDHKLDADLVDDTTSTNKFVTSAEKTTWNNKSDFSGSYNDLTNKPDLNIYARSADLANVATSGAYSDLTGAPTNVSSFTNDAGYITSSALAGYATEQYVDTAIDNLPEPMVFKGTLGTSGTITDLPVASSANEGFTYKVITAGTYQSIVCKVGDVVVSNGSAWVLIPAGDTDSDTWRDIDINGSSFKGSAISTGKINFKNGSNVTITGSGNDITIAATDTTYESKSAASEGTDVSLVTTGEKYIWNNKLDNHCVEVDISEVTPVIDGDLYTCTKDITVEEFNQIRNTDTHEIRVTVPQTMGLGTVLLSRMTAYNTVGLFGNVLGHSPQLNAVLNMRGLATQTGATQYQFIFEIVANQYQTKLTSGTNIKTINKESLLGSGNIDTAAAIIPLLDNKQDKEVNGNIWTTKTWTGLNSLDGHYIWTDGENIYCSNYWPQYVLDKSTSTWSEKTWTGLTEFYGYNVWTDGSNIYYSDSTNHYILDKATSTWSTKTWTGLTSFYGQLVWTDGTNIYYSYNSEQYILDKSTATWSSKTWQGLTNFDCRYIWTDSENIYYSDGSIQYVLDKSTSTWSEKTWTGLTEFSGEKIWIDGENIYYSDGSSNYVLDKSTSTWSEKTWTGLTEFYGYNVWTDEHNIYYSEETTQYVLNKVPLVTTSISSSSTDDQVPSAKCVYDSLASLKLIEIGETGQTTPSASLAVGGLFLKEI